MRCEVCGRKSTKLGCDRCWSRGFSFLADLPEYYSALEAFLLPSKGYGEKVQATRTPPIPARIQVLHLRAGGISGILIRHEQTVRSELRHTIANTGGDEYQKIERSVIYLRAQWDWIRDNYSTSILTDLDSLYGEIQGAIGNKSEDITIGTCPAIDSEGITCGALLRINYKILETMADIRCPHCASVWESSKWRLLGQVIEQTSIDYARSSVPAIQGVN